MPERIARSRALRLGRVCVLQEWKEASGAGGYGPWAVWRGRRTRLYRPCGYFVAIGGLAGQQSDLIRTEKPVLTARRGHVKEARRRSRRLREEWALAEGHPDPKQQTKDSNPVLADSRICV